MLRIIVAAAIAAAALPVTAQQQAPTAQDLMYKKPEPVKTGSKLGVSVEASILLGLGVSVSAPVGDLFNLRGTYHSYTYSYEQEDEDGNYDAELRLKSFGALLDYFPFAGGFRVTAGLKSNGNEINLNGVANDSGEFEVGDCSYTSNPNDPLFVNGTVDFKSSAPYLGIGWGGNTHAEPGFFGLFDIGVMFSGAPTAALTAGGSATVSNNPNNVANGCGAPGSSMNVSNDPNFQRELRKAEDEANEEAKDFKLWPNIAFGFGYRF